MERVVFLLRLGPRTVHGPENGAIDCQHPQIRMTCSFDTGVPVAARAYPERNPVRGLMVPRDRLKSAVESVLRATRAFLEALNSSLCLQPQDAPLSSPAIVTAAPAEGLGAAPKHPTAFLSYAWDSLDHKTWVHELATRLRRDGVESVLDQWALAPGDQLPEFMERACRDSDFVVIICTPEYKLKSDGRKGGVGYEGDIMTAEVLRTRKHRKFVPVLRGASAEESTPAWLAGKFHIDLRGVPFSEAEYQKLVRALHGALPAAPAVAAEPPLFVSDSQLAEAEAPPRRLSDEFSDLGARLLEHVIRRSANGVVWDPMLGTEEVLRELTMTPEDFADAANELEEQGLLRIRKDANSRHGIAGVGPEARCFARYDAFIQPWDPARDAEAVAEQLLASPGQAVGTRPLATALGWPLRRLNPAIAVLDEEGVVRIPRVVLGDGAVIGPYVHATDKIRRWLRASRGDR